MLGTNVWTSFSDVRMELDWIECLGQSVSWRNLSRELWARALKCWENVRYPLHVTCCVSHVTCHMPLKKIYIYPFFFIQNNSHNNKCWKCGGVSCGRVCYQRGYPVYFIKEFCKLLKIKVFNRSYNQEPSHKSES